MSELQERTREERSQARARIAYSVIAMVYFVVVFEVLDIGTGEDFHLLLGVATATLLYSLALLFLLPRSWTFSPLRQGISVGVDIGAISYVMYALGELGALFYPLYLWVISGNGLRFGVAYLWFAMGLGMIGFALLISYNDYWQHNHIAGIGLLLGVVVLPSFFSVLIRRLHQLNNRLESMVRAKDYLATHDDLTGLCNRYCFKQRLDEEIARARRNAQRFSLLYIDLDGFKQVNDSRGHEAGDQLLQTVAKRLLREIRTVDLAVRLGGDEFAVITMSGDEPDRAAALARRIDTAVSQPYEIHDARLSVGVSVGVAHFPDDGDDAETLMRVADLRMYRQKA